MLNANFNSFLLAKQYVNLLLSRRLFVFNVRSTLAIKTEVFFIDVFHRSGHKNSENNMLMFFELFVSLNNTILFQN